MIQPGADEREAIVVRPDAAERRYELLLGGEPVRLGIDEGAVHVPEDGGREEFGHGIRV